MNRALHCHKVGNAMRSIKISAVISRAYDNVQMALWASLLAFVVWFAIAVVPEMPARRAEFEAHRARELAGENAQLCKKLNFLRGSREYDQCVLDIGQFRLRVERRFVQETEF